ncbi:hypothetical protein AB835_14345 [Candidatus Endobugula sertula]|uniref:LysM domain-containing protein n=1 Tax=Candidatus Endobugula sertula TaxID=62101 RepID=A0A1D2QLG5_9GAMM|nr:hypothetical protein AB835_14345 [Candidatus Endobugula sertula]
MALAACDATLPTKNQTLSDSPEQNQQRSIAPPLPRNIVASNKAASDLWQRIRDGYQLPVNTIPSKGQKRIEAILSRYAHRPDSILRQTNRASLYLYYIVNELEKHNMPAELALLPFVESGYDPFAYSSGRASGLWQFIPSTGKRFKLTENWWMDERRDVIASTQAAIQYFTYLHQHFKGDWLLAIAAYNAGEGTVGRAIRKNRKEGKPIDYWSLTLPKETQFYVPKLLAWSTLIKHPQKYQVNLTPINNSPQFTVANIGSQIDLATFSELTTIDINTVYALNPAFNHWSTDPAKPHTLIIPADKDKLVAKVLKQYPIGQRIQWQRYTIRPGDSLGYIANKFDVHIATLKSANKLKGSIIRAGKTLMIPKASKPAEFYNSSVGQRLEKRQNSHTAKRDRERIVHKVQQGETLWSISRVYHVPPQKIAYWNNMSTKDILRNKQRLIIWSTKSAKQEISGIIRKIHYSVKSGESLSTIANKFNVSVNNILAWNNIHQKQYIQPGQNLKLFVSTSDQANRF